MTNFRTRLDFIERIYISFFIDCMFLLFCMLAVTLALERSPECDVPTIEGHLHLTMMKQKNATTTCKFPLKAETTFIEIERYSGRYLDDNAWMNFTFEGSPPVQISIGANQIWFQDMNIGIPTLTTLETSMWLAVSRTEDQATCHFSPPRASSFGHLFNVEHISLNEMTVVASSSKGMEQVIQNISSTMPELETTVKQKTIHALEKRISDIEKELRDMHQRDDKHERVHERHGELHGEHWRRTNEVGKQKDTHDLEIQSLRGGIFKWVGITLILIVVLIGVSWRTYQRQTKLSRWTL